MVVFMATLFIFLVLILCGSLQPKPMHGYSPNVQDMFKARDTGGD